MPRVLLTRVLPVALALASAGVGAFGWAWASGSTVGKLETRLEVVEDCAGEAAETLRCHDERIRAVESATAVLPSMAQDIREIREDLGDLTNLLVALMQDRETR